MTDTEDERKRGVFLLPLGNTRRWIGESLWEEGRGLSMIKMEETTLWLMRIVYPNVGYISWQERLGLKQKVSKSAVNKQIHVFAVFLVEVESFQKQQEIHLSSLFIYVVDLVQPEPAFLWLSQGGNKVTALTLKSKITSSKMLARKRTSQKLSRGKILEQWTSIKLESKTFAESIMLNRTGFRVGVLWLMY